VRWPEVRAGLIALAIGIGLVQGCPLPPPKDTPAWERGFVEPLRSVRHVVLTPVAWIEPTLRITQRFALFQGSETKRFRLEIDGQDAAFVWHPLYRAGSDSDALLEYRRVRGSWDPLDAPPGAYQAFALWYGHRILAEQPTLGAVRVRFARIVLDLGDVYDTGTYAFPIVTVRR
jgi:hypothetical protein